MFNNVGYRDTINFHIMPKNAKNIYIFFVFYCHIIRILANFFILFYLCALAYSAFRARPMINRRTSLVPAPISYNLASLSILPVG